MPQQFWKLLARKLAGEASGRELYELDKLLYSQPELQFWARLVTELWRNREAIEKEPGGEEMFLQLLQEAFQRKIFGDSLRAEKKAVFPLSSGKDVFFLPAIRDNRKPACHGKTVIGRLRLYPDSK